MIRIGITGHQGLDTATSEVVSKELAEELARRGPVCGVSSLAEGADQLFAQEVLRQGGSLTAVIPCAGYEMSFSATAALRSYRLLVQRANEVVELDYDSPSEQAYWAAGQKVVKLSERMLAVWDGRTSGGLGGTADVVAFARSAGIPVSVIWPLGAKRP